MKIAIVHPSLAVHGGAEHVVVWMAAELVRRDHAVTVVTTAYDAAFFGRPEWHGFRLVTDDLGGYAIHPVRFIRAGWRLREALVGFDWVNPHNFPAYHWVYWARRLNPGIGRVVWFCEEPMRAFYPEACNPHFLEMQRRARRPSHGGPSWLQKPAGAARRFRHWQRQWPSEVAKIMDRWVVPRLDLVLANSEFIAGQVRRIFKVPAHACLLGIPPRRFASEPGADASRGGGRYLLTVSRLHPEKNIETVLEAIAILRKWGNVPFDRYVVAGDGPLMDHLRSRARDLAIDDIVTFLGFVSEDELARLYRHAELVVYIPLDETYGLVFPEAALWKKVVIAPDHGGPTEIVRHGETGLQVDPTSPHAVADAIASCLHQPDVLARFGEAAYRYATEHLTIGRFVDRFEDLLRMAGSR